MKLSFSSNAFTRFTIFEAVERIAALGYKGVELLADAPHMYADTFTSEDVGRLEAVLSKTGLSVANINANTAVGYYGRGFWEPLFEPSLAHPDPELRQWRLNYSKKCVDFAAALGAKNISVTSGRCVADTSPAESLRYLTESLEELLAYAEARNVNIGMEYEPGLLVERADELLSLIASLDSNRFGVNLDLGHSHVLGEAPHEVISAFGGRIFHIHIEDIRGGKHYHLIPGRGDMDFDVLFNEVRSVGYTGRLTVELYTHTRDPDAAAAESLAFLEKYL